MISVCMTTYNGERFVEQQITSILAQLGRGDELVISDDASVDTTCRRIRTIHDTRIRLLTHTSHLGLRRNLCTALAAAKGDVIFLADQDDVWLPGKVEHSLRALSSHELVITDAQVTDEQLKILYPSLFQTIHVHVGVLRNFFRCTFYGSGMAMRRSLYEKTLPMPDTDLILPDWWIGMVASLTDSIAYIHTSLYLYRRHKESLTPVHTRFRWFYSPRSLSQRLASRIIMAYYLLQKWCHL